MMKCTLSELSGFIERGGDGERGHLVVGGVYLCVNRGVNQTERERERRERERRERERLGHSLWTIQQPLTLGQCSRVVGAGRGALTVLGCAGWLHLEHSS